MTESLTRSTSAGRSPPTGRTFARSGPLPHQYVIGAPVPPRGPTFRWSSVRIRRRCVRWGTPASVPGAADAELVALRVCEHDPAFAPLVEGPLEPGCAGTDQPLGLALDVGGVDVEVHAVLRRLRLAHTLKDQLMLGAVAGTEDDVLAGGGHLLVPECARPEGSESLGVLAVKNGHELHRPTG